MADYSQYIHKNRRSRPTPASIVDEDGRCVFGTFDREFSDFDLEKAKRPTRAPQNMNKLRLTLWEAAEIHVPEGILLTAVCDMGLFGTVMVLFYDQKTGKVYNWSSTLPSSGTKIAPDLIEDTVTEAETSSGFVRFVNDFGSGRAHMTGSLKNGVLTGEKKGTAGVVYDLHLTKITDPSIVCIPFGPNRPLYTEKAFFKATGTITLNGKNLTVNEDTTAVIDDHRGYYPRRMHFDWTAAMGWYPVGYNGENEFISFNLTKNQSTDPEQYNENLIFRENGTSFLPPVNFEQIGRAHV